MALVPALTRIGRDPWPKPFGYKPEEFRARVVFKLIDKGHAPERALEHAARICAFVEGRK